MKELIKPKLSGHVTVTIGDEVVLDEHNDIHANANEVLLRALGVLSSPNNKVDTVRMVGVFGTKNIAISTAAIDVANHTVSFTATAMPSDFNGVVTALYLIMSQTSLTLAFKTGLTLAKDLNTTMRVVWKIKLVVQ